MNLTTLMLKESKIDVRYSYAGMKWNKRKQEWVKVEDYTKMPKVRRDNQNFPVWVLKGITSKNPKVRVPSKKHKNRYKNFLKMFPNYEKEN